MGAVRTVIRGAVLAQAAHAVVRRRRRRRGFFIERLVEPLPDESVRDRSPEDCEHLRSNPCFLVLRIVKPGG